MEKVYEKFQTHVQGVFIGKYLEDASTIPVNGASMWVIFEKSRGKEMVLNLRSTDLHYPNKLQSIQFVLLKFGST